MVLTAASPARARDATQSMERAFSALCGVSLIVQSGHTARVLAAALPPRVRAHAD